MRTFRIALGMVLAVALIAAGCGGDDDDDGDTTAATEATTDATEITGEASTKEQWIATADEVCKNAENEAVRAAEQQGVTGESPPAEIRTFSETVTIPIQQSVIDTLRGLAPPEGEEEATAAFLDEAQSALDTVEGDPDLLSDPAAADAEFDEADRLAAEYGLQECGGD